MRKAPFLLLLLSSLLSAQELAPLPEKLLKAKAVYLVNSSGDLKAFDKFFQELRKWNHFSIVASRDHSEIVMELATTQGSTVAVSGTSVGGVVMGSATPILGLQLRILDSSTSDVLWTDVTDKWMTSGHAPTKLVSNLRKRMPEKQTAH
jgi:hypothetical protein